LTVHISFRNPSQYIYDLESNEENTSKLKQWEIRQAICILVSMDVRMEITFTRTGLMHEQVLGDPAEI
jgi:hypothetical protein